MKKTLVKYYHAYQNAKAIRIVERSDQKPIGYARIYHVHIRKSAGTSVNAAFWDKTGYNLSNIGRKSILTGKDFVCVRNNKVAIEKGNYFYANSHQPLWSINLKPKTFTFCILRDPYRRLLSLYKYYLWIQSLNPKNAKTIEPYYDSLIKESACVKDGFDAFLNSLKKSDLSNQLYMFSENYDVHEAINACKSLDRVFFQDHFEDAIHALSEIAGFALAIKHERKSVVNREIEISDVQRKRAVDLLKDEYSFYNQILSKTITK